MKISIKTSLFLLFSVCAALYSCTKEVEPSYEGQSVDLGLSVKWAQTNVGAVKREDVGAYFSWGEILPKTSYDYNNYKWFDKNHRLLKYCTSESAGEVDGKTILEAEDDIATITNGKGWRMPTFGEFKELLDNCTWTWATLNGIRGYKVTSNVPGYAGNYIFLPAGGEFMNDEEPVTGHNGYYWAGEIQGSYNCDLAYIISFDITTVSDATSARFVGYNVRPVFEK